VTRIRPFLKWAGGKYALINPIVDTLPEAKQLIEPFVGSGSVFLNTNYSRYRLSDANADLINLYQTLKQNGDQFIAEVKNYFQPKYNQSDAFYDLRKTFNHSQDNIEKAMLFLYLNRHSYNGLCRYNNEGHFNVPFGRYAKPYFPETEMAQFLKKSKKATFHCEDFTKTMKRARKGSIVYCDPPYVPLSDTAYFTSYHRNEFGLKEHKHLAELANQLAARGIPVIISNHDTSLTRKLCHNATITSFMVRRYISCKGRKQVKEMFALFE